jgi:hypothetical protein
MKMQTIRSQLEGFLAFFEGNSFQIQYVVAYSVANIVIQIGIQSRLDALEHS